MPPPPPPSRLPAAAPPAAAPAAGGSTLRWLTDATLAVGLAAAVAAVVAVDAARRPADPPTVVAVTPPTELAEPPPEPPPEPPLPSPATEPVDDTPPPQPPPIVEKPLDPTRQFGLGSVGASDFGLSLNIGKKLTFSQCGETNNTMLSVDGRAGMIGHDRRFIVKDFPTDERSDFDSEKKDGGVAVVQGDALKDQDAYETVWRHPIPGTARRGDIQVTHRFEYAYGETSRTRDTLKVTYTLENLGRRPHDVGLRTLIDTYIGGHDGVPFVVPGREGVVTSPLVLTEVPDAIYAIERPDLSDATMTVVKLRFGLDDLERPSRVHLIRFPYDTEEPVLDPDWEYDTRRPFDGSDGGKADSAVVLYFDPKPLAPGATRTFGFSYGLGDLSSRGQAGATLALFPPAFTAGKAAQVTVVGSNVGPARRVTLTLPPGLAFEPGEAAEKPIAAGRQSQQSWRVRALPAAGGDVTLVAKLAPDGTTAEVTAGVKSTAPAIKLVRGGEAKAGGRVRVTATVVNAAAGQAVTLDVPAGARLDAGEAAAKPVAGPVGQASWVVLLDRACPPAVAFRARLTPGTATATLTEAVAPMPPRLAVGAAADKGAKVVAGKPFWVWAQVAPDRPGQTATLTLPAGLTLVPGHAATKPLEAKPGCGYAAWRVTAAAPGRVEATVAADGVAPAPLAVDVERSSVIGN